MHLSYSMLGVRHELVIKMGTHFQESPFSWSKHLIKLLINHVSSINNYWKTVLQVLDGRQSFMVTANHNVANRQRIVLTSCSTPVFDANPHDCEINFLQKSQILKQFFPWPSLDINDSTSQVTLTDLLQASSLIYTCISTLLSLNIHDSKEEFLTSTQAVIMLLSCGTPRWFAWRL